VKSIVKPTIKGTKVAKDEVLEEAIEIINDKTNEK